MVTRLQHKGNQQGVMLLELLVAMSILGLFLIPLSYSFANDQKLCRAYYHRAVAMEIVDGEMEILKAGEWREFKDGRQIYPVRADAATNLPAGSFTLTVKDRRFRLEWVPQAKDQGGRVSREMEVR
jgi:hypothetical protein